ncbi:uncharacterized protein DUF4159 [Roseimicrobium gellanilyticum]|uniref:Uncharacterized protein DUF4159 n=1 Tax=Roseimicrobium gellanilyticum TaxID=748857 RepID=A0A366HPK3_9BACT|nr:DUF4159 domain-containing protein [Roseimicrobium gellanilyticum]RBP45044.1 uncharacterized protein DUF4159 [Roseimicrobium gellanilyticum]
MKPAFLISSAMAIVAALAPVPSSSAKEGIVQCGNLIYAAGKTSTCFSDEFLSTAQKETSIATDRRFKAVKLSGEELFLFPFAIMTGEGDYTLAPKERENMKKYLTSGGFLLASAGCSNKEWDRAFRREMKTIFGAEALKKLPLDHAIFRTVYKVSDLGLKKSEGNGHLEGIEHNGKLVVVYSADGLNNTANAPGCCCCGGNEITNSLQLNVNILAYALLH